MNSSVDIAVQKEELASQELVFCKTGYLIDMSFQRMCSVVVEHAGEPEMDDHFREAVRDSMEELLHHRRECPKCSQHYVAQTLPEETKRDKDSSPADRSRQRMSGELPGSCAGDLAINALRFDYRAASLFCVGSDTVLK